MTSQPDLERLYVEASQALKARDYDHASGLLKQILVIDENYKDTSRLLARIVREKRQRWYNNRRTWGALVALLLAGLGFALFPILQDFLNRQPAPATAALPTGTHAQAITPPSTATEMRTPIATPIPLTWKRINIGQEFPRDKVIAFEMDPKDPDVLYIQMKNAGYYQSIDGGNSWRPIQPEEIGSGSLASSLTEVQYKSDFFHTAPDGKQRIYRFDGFWNISEDDGKTWKRFSEAGTYRSNAIAFDPSGAVYVFCGNNICKFSPDTKNLTILGKPDIGADTLLVISPHDPKIIYAAGEGLAVSQDGGYFWMKLNNGLGNSLLYIEAGMSTPDSLYLQLGDCNRGRPRATMEQPLYRSMDNGVTWELLDKQGCFLIMDADGQSMYRIATDSDYYDPWIWRLSNNGARWDMIPIPSAVKTLATHPTQNGVLYAYDEQEPQNMYVSENYGYNWEKNPPASTKLCHGSTLQFLDTYRPMAIDPFDGKHVFVIDNGMLLESHDSCNTTKSFATSPNTNLNSAAFDPNKQGVLYAGTDGGAYISFDSGQTWGQVNDGLLGATVVYSIVVDKDSNVYAATPYGIFKLESK